ncbi:MAG TPA: hypothetical protein VMZ52_12205, partial [Bryobacteraceae bacterium]|nr:hypothetical protein [Bryobacteraceae bacterium]
VLTLYLLAIGNIFSVRNPRPVDPAQSWRNSSVGRVQAFLLLVYPIAAVPVGLAFGARYAFDSELAFYAVLALDVVVGAVFYWIAMESAVGAAEAHKEHIVAVLSRSDSPVAS